MTVFFVAAAAAALGIVWTVQVLAKINLVTDTGQSIGTFLKLASMLLPSVIPIILPFAVLIGVTQTLSTMGVDSEMAVIAASGAKRGVVVRPALLLAALASLFLLFITQIVEPYSRQTVRSMVASANADLLTLAIQEGSFKRVEDNLYVQIAKREANGVLSGIFIADSRDPAVDLIYYARDGVVTKTESASLLLMSNGEVHRRTLKDSALSVIRFKSYAFDLSAFTTAVGGIALYPKDRYMSYLLNPYKNDKTFQNQPQLYTAEIHKRLTVWIYPLLFALIALSVVGGVRSHRAAHFNITLVAGAATMFVRWLGLYFEDLAENSMLGVYGLYMIPACVLACSLWAIARQRQLRLTSIPQHALSIAKSYLSPCFQWILPIFERYYVRLKGQPS